MGAQEKSVDYVYIAASALDFRYTRICVASVRYFYPSVPIRLLAGSRLQRGLTAELRRYWDVETAPVPAGDYGWGFVKLEPLFGPYGEKFLVLDSDTVLTGRVVDLWEQNGAFFLVDDEEQSEAATKRLYYDWANVHRIDSAACRPQFVFNTGQWFGTAGVLTRDDFAPWIEWTMPRRLRHPEHFMPGEQGILNYVLNQKAGLARLTIERRKIMWWPGHSMQGLNVQAVSNRLAPPRIVHWAGIKKTRQREMLAADLLKYFESFYYDRLPAGGVRKILAGCEHASVQWIDSLKLKVRLASLGRLRTRSRT